MVTRLSRVPGPPRSARSERTRAALWRAAQVRFLAQGVEATSAEQIAADAGVSLRTFYRHFSSKQDLLFGDYDASLQWFRAALAQRPADESIVDAVRAAIHSFPFDPGNVYDIAALRDRELDRADIVRHIRQVQAEFADEVERHLVVTTGVGDGDGDARFLTAVAARCIAAATFTAVDTWMRGDHSDLEELDRLTDLALRRLDAGVVSVLEPGVG